MSLCGTASDHCCYLREHGVCTYVRPKTDDDEYQWKCSLRTDLGSWEAVHSSQEYQSNVKPKLIEIGIQQDCGDWPPPGQTCKTCGQVGE